METQHQFFENTTVQQTKQQHSSVPSSSSSPSHEFTFTISLNPAPRANKIPDNNELIKPSLHHHQPSGAAAVNLSPADEIFFHGHLLPLQLVSSSNNLPVISPRLSTNSLDSFTLPVKNQHHHHNHHHQARSFQEERRRPSQEQKGSKEKSNSFSLFGNIKKEEEPSRKKESISDNQGHRKKSKFEMLKHYLRLVKPYLTLRNNAARKGNNINNNSNNAPRPYSLSSGNLLQVNKNNNNNNRREMTRGKNNIRGDDRLFSAPASMRVSPTNSGRLNVPSGTLSPIAKSDSTMEELQAAIQAAIAHCKKSIDNASDEDTIIRFS